MDVHAVSSALRGLTDALTGVSSVVGTGLMDPELIDVVAACEVAKRGLAAVQADATAALSTSVKAADAVRGRPARDRGCSVAPMIAAARGVSPYHGGRHVGMANALVDEMPHTLSALRSGRIEEWTATGIVAATAFLTPDQRGLVDSALVKKLTRHGVPGSRIVGSARALAQQIDPAAAVARARQAEGERRVTIRPAPDTMTFVTALLPARDGVSLYAALKRAAAEHQNTRAPGDDRTHNQVMVDTLVARTTGRDPHTEAPRVVVNLVMTQNALFGQGEEPASIPGLGSIPARTARAMIADADQAWLRRLHTSPDGGTLIAMDAKQRLFPRGLATFLTLRDQRCATPYCDAPIQHLDHITPHATGGATSADNGQGLCARCTYTKEQPGFSTTRDPVTGDTTWTTPTGHEYPRTPPPVLGHPVLPMTTRASLEAALRLGLAGIGRGTRRARDRRRPVRGRRRTAAGQAGQPTPQRRD